MRFVRVCIGKGIFIEKILVHNFFRSILKNAINKSLLSFSPIPPYILGVKFFSFFKKNYYYLKVSSLVSYAPKYTLPTLYFDII